MQDASSTSSNTVQDDARQERPVRYGTEELVESLQDQISFLRRELERKDAIMLRMTERIPELEVASSPPDSRDAHETASEHSTGGDVTSVSQESEKRSWWRRFFGIE
jgi:hypothetical protein